MPKATPAPTPTSDVEWDTLQTGSLGEQWDFERDGPLDGNFIGTRTVETQKVESGEATAYLFAPHASPDSVVFVWGSAEITNAFEGDLIRVGDRVRISYLGTRQFTGGDGKPRIIKQFKVQVPKDPAQRT